MVTYIVRLRYYHRRRFRRFNAALTHGCSVLSDWQGLLMGVNNTVGMTSGGERQASDKRLKQTERLQKKGSLLAGGWG